MSQLSLSARVFRGSLWVSVVRIAQKSFSAIRAIILARLLAPEDFGLFGVAALILLAFEVLTRTGFDDAIIHKRGNVEPYLHTSYWIQVGRGIILASVVFFSAPFVATFFNEPTVIPLVRFLSLVQFFRGFQSIGVVLLQRELNFRDESVYLTAGIITEFVVTVSLAFILRNAWALVIGAVVAEITRMGLSFIVHPYRPHLMFSLSKAKDLVDFGIWLLLSGIVSYIALQADNIFVGRWIDVEALGMYQMAFLLASLPTLEVTKLINRVLKPAYAELQEIPERLSAVVVKTIGLTGVLVLPASVGLIVVTPIMVPVLLGEKWLGIISFLPILALGGLFRAIGGSSSALLVATGNTRLLFMAELARAVTLLLLLYPAFIWGNLEGIAWTTVFSTGSMLLIMLWAIHRITANVAEVLRQLLPPTVASLIMAISLMMFIDIVPLSWLGLISIVGGGVAIYALIVAVLDKQTVRFVLRLVHGQMQKARL